MRYLLLLFVATIAYPAPAKASCQVEAFQKLELEAQHRQSDLLKITIEEMATGLAPSLQRQILRFKNALAGVIDAEMMCASSDDSATAIQSRLVMLLRANQPEKSFVPYSDASEAPQDGVYGNDLKLQVSVPANVAHMMAITASFGIECGDDTVLLLYERASDGWRRRLRWQAKPYSDISGAFGDFFLFSILPGKETKALRVVAAHGTAWCTSRFSAGKIDVLAPAGGSGDARVIWHTERSLSRGDFVVRLKTMPEVFEVRWNAPALDIIGYERTVIYRYSIAGDVVTRVGPIATNGRGFVEEWLKMPWDEARNVTASDAIAGMRPVHEDVAQANKDPKSYISYSYGPVRACTVKGRYEVEMDADPGGPQFFAILEGKDGYMMVNYGTTQDERCSGADIMKR